MPQNPYQPPQQQQPTPPMAGGPRPNQELELIVPVNVSPLALIAGYMGLAAVLCVPAPIAVLLGVLALRDLEQRPDRTGKGRAWFGIIAGGLGTLGLVIGLIARMTK